MQWVKFFFTVCLVMVSIGIRKVLAFLEAHERNQAWLARRVDVSEALVSLVVNGARPCSDELAKRLSRETGVPVRDFKRAA